MRPKEAPTRKVTSTFLLDVLLAAKNNQGITWDDEEGIAPRIRKYLQLAWQEESFVWREKIDTFLKQFEAAAGTNPDRLAEPGLSSVGTNSRNIG